MREKDREQQNRRPTKSSALAPVALALWLGAGMGFIAMSWFVLPRFMPVFESLDVEPPAATVLGVQAATWLGTWPGLCAGLGILAGSLLLYLLGARGSLFTWSHGLAAVLAILLAGATMVPVYKLERHLGEGHPAPRLQR